MCFWPVKITARIKQGNTEQYQNDTRALLDKVLNHDDSVNQRYEGSKLHEAQVRFSRTISGLIKGQVGSLINLPIVLY